MSKLGLAALCVLVAARAAAADPQGAPASAPTVAPATDPAAADQARAAACRVDDTSTISRTYVEHRPQFFFKPIPGTDLVGYIRNDTPDDDNNALLDLKTGQDRRIKGKYDPVPTPDGRYITTPDNTADDSNPADTGGLYFYRRDAFKGTEETSLAANPILGGTDGAMDGVYQSVGSLSGSGARSTYRVLADSSTQPSYVKNGGGIVIRDYTISHGPPSSVVTRGPVREVCGNLSADDGGKRHLQLPMISKDGRRVAALDMDAMPPVTKVWRIDDHGSCSGEVSLGIRTGKVDFNFGNGDQVAFAVPNNETLVAGYFDVPSDKLVSNVYVLDLGTGRIRRITANTESNSIYPSFRKDGTIVYMDQPKGAGEGDGGSAPRSSFVVANPGLADEASWDGDWRAATGLSCQDAAGAKRFKSQVALGALWSRICSVYGGTTGAGTAALLALDLDPARCRKMVADFWKDNQAKLAASAALVASRQVTRDDLGELTADDVKAACPKKARPAVTAQVVGDPGAAPSAKAAASEYWPASTPTACVNCHGHIFANKDELKTRKVGDPPIPWAQAAIQQIRDGKMPRGTLSPDEDADWGSKKEQFLKDLQSIANGEEP